MLNDLCHFVWAYFLVSAQIFSEINATRVYPILTIICMLTFKTLTKVKGHNTEVYNDSLFGTSGFWHNRLLFFLCVCVLVTNFVSIYMSYFPSYLVLKNTTFLYIVSFTFNISFYLNDNDTPFWEWLDMFKITKFERYFWYVIYIPLYFMTARFKSFLYVLNFIFNITILKKM